MLKRGNCCFPTTTKTSRSKTIDHFTIACLVAWPLNESEASFSFKGQATKHTFVKWSIPHKNSETQKRKTKTRNEISTRSVSKQKTVVIHLPRRQLFTEVVFRRPVLEGKLAIRSKGIDGFKARPRKLQHKTRMKALTNTHPTEKSLTLTLSFNSIGSPLLSTGRSA